MSIETGSVITASDISETYTNISNKLDEILDSINNESGVELPALTNPASAAEVGEGYDTINAAGERMVGTGELAVNLAPELTAQDTLIADIMTALEGKSAASGAEVVTGVFTVSSNSIGSITIPGLIGKNNFSLLYLGSVAWDDIAGMKMLAVHLIGGANGEIAYGYHMPEDGYYSDTGTVGLGATAWDSSTGTLTRTTAPSVFAAGDWRYIGW